MSSGPDRHRARRRRRRGRGFRRHRRLGRTAPDVRPGGHGSAARAEPSLAGSVDAGAPLTPIAQDDLVGDDLAGALAGISWPDEVAGCVLALGIMAGGPDTDEPSAAAQSGAAETSGVAVEGRLVVGVLRDRPGGSCLLRWRSSPQELLRGPGLAPGLLAALHATFED